MKYFYWISTAVLAAVLIYLFFIPAFAGRIAIPSQIDLGFFALRYYGLLIALAILVGYLVAKKNSWRFGISPAEVDDLAFWLVIVGFLGARIYYVIFSWSYYSGNISEIYKIWHGGISIYGALIADLIFIFIYSRKKAYSAYQLLDLAALSTPLAQAIGRFGNFFNQEAFGKPTNLPWKMFVSQMYRPNEFRNINYFHPTFLYEAIWDVLTFFILLQLLKRKRKPGVLAFVYLGVYSVGRFFVEWLRLDSFFVARIRIDQAVAVLGIIFAAIMLMYRRNDKKR